MEAAAAAKPASMVKREDWRDVPLVTIDRRMPRIMTTPSMPNRILRPTTKVA